MIKSRTEIAFIATVSVILMCIVGMMLLIWVASAIPYQIAQESDLAIQMQNPSGSCWFFPANDHIDPVQIYDIPARSAENETYCALTRDQTANMVSGRYNLVYTYPTIAGTKILKDVSWQNNSLVSVFRDGGILNENGKLPSDTRLDLLNFVNKTGIDGIEEYYIEIQQPFLQISSINQINESYFHIAGTSNYDDGTPVKITIDEIRHYSQHDNANYTFHTAIHKTNETLGFWGVDMKLPVQEMTAGGGQETIWHDAYAYCGQSIATVQFPLYQTWEPSPTPTQYVAYLGNGNIAPVTVVVTKEIINTVYEDRWHTATPTPDITDALGNKIDYPYAPGTPLPVTLIALLAVVAIAIGIIRRKR